MYLVSRSLYRASFLVAFAAAALSFGCGKKTVAPPPPPAPAPAPARPTVTLQASPASVNKGESSTLSWNSTDATQLSIEPEVGAVTAQGTTKVTPSDSTTYTITASVIAAPVPSSSISSLWASLPTASAPSASARRSLSAWRAPKPAGSRIVAAISFEQTDPLHPARHDDRLVTRSAARPGKPLPPRGSLIRVEGVPWPV